jgi:hypothetical protein
MSLDDLTRTAEMLARRTDSRRSFLGKIGKAVFVAAAAVAAGISVSDVVEAGTCTFTGGTCSGCPQVGGCPTGCLPDKSIHRPGNCWWSGYNECCDCICGGTYCGCRSWGFAPGGSQRAA